MTYLFVLLDNNHACTENLVIVWKLGLQLHVQSVPITTEVVSSKPTQARCIRCNIM